jgi:hypothetical protein
LKWWHRSSTPCTETNQKNLVEWQKEPWRVRRKESGKEIAGEVDTKQCRMQKKNLPEQPCSKTEPLCIHMPKSPFPNLSCFPSRSENIELIEWFFGQIPEQVADTKQQSRSQPEVDSGETITGRQVSGERHPAEVRNTDVRKTDAYLVET